MDLVTLVTACALSVEPKLMHALIWHQSGGEPWAVAVQNEPMSRVLLEYAGRGQRGALDIYCERHRPGRISGFANLSVESKRGNVPTVPECCHRSAADCQTCQAMQETSRSLDLSNLLRGCRLSRLVATTGCQIRGCGSNDRRERRRSQRRYAEGCQHRIARYWIRDATAVEWLSFCVWLCIRRTCPRLVKRVVPVEPAAIRNRVRTALGMTVQLQSNRHHLAFRMLIHQPPAPIDRLFVPTSSLRKPQ